MSDTSLFVCLAQFELDPKDREEFVRALLANRKETVTTEHGNRMYEVCIPEDDEGRVILIEFYDNREAFDFHHLSAHWHRWNDTAAHLIKNRTVTFMARRL
jgi:quinol monooxygenase YgiN